MGTPIARVTFGNAVTTSQAAGSQSVIQQLVIAPGGHTGWHTHPGGTVILVQAGTFTFYDSTCAKTVVNETRGAFEAGGHVQLARNEGTLPLLLTVVYFDVPVGAAVRSNATTPACAVANALPAVATGSGVSFNVPGGIVQRATFAAAFSATGAADRDLLLQRVTIEPGGHSGWHGHPGATVVYIESGTLTFYDEHCVKQTYSAGQGTVEPANHRLLARNEGTTQVVLRAVFFDVPVAGSARIDRPEPSTCTGLVAGSAAAPAAVAPPRSLPATSTEPSYSAAVAMLVALASVAGLAMARRRSRTS